MLKWMLACCKVYISESRNKVALESIERAARLFPEARVINKFEDVTYNRVGYTLVSGLDPKPSSESCALKSAVLAMVKAAFEAIDLELHFGSHPRLGVVDHICFHPLALVSLDQVAGIAKNLARDVGSSLEVPTFVYGAAHEEGRTLDSIRRELGYFKPNSGNQWEGGPRSLPLEPDEGPARVTREKGVVVIGATRWVDNYNIPVFSSDIAAVRRIAKRVSGRGGGLPSVQAMALTHGEDVIEVACNLLEPSQVGGDRVQQEVERLAKEEGVAVGKGYFTDFSQEKIVESYARPNFTGNHQWTGWTLPAILPENSNETQPKCLGAIGIAMIGAGPWIALYNVQVMSTNLSAPKRIARMADALAAGDSMREASLLNFGGPQ